MMKHLFALGSIVCIALAGLMPTSQVKPAAPLLRYFVERPTINIPMAARQKNWVDWANSGSCVHASMVMILRWQGQNDLAAFWRAKYAGGEWNHTFEEKLRENKIPFASTFRKNDVAFLEWAIRTRRGAIVTVMDGKHMVCLVELTDTQAGILDNNAPETIKWVPRDQFLATWFTSNSWSCTPMFTPPPPILRNK